MSKHAATGLLVALSLACSAPREEEAPDPVLAPPAREIDPDLEEAACERCHVEEAREWRRSAHRTAFADEVFQAEWRPRSQPECVRCHAPRADAERPEGEAAESGISCVVCHVRDGAVLATHDVEGSPHAITVDPALRTVEACAGCHDFSFARIEPTPYGDGMVQSTVREHREVEDRGTCQDCHMREGERVSHGFLGARDATLLSGALEVEASASDVGDRTEVTLVLRSTAGHRVPTGDMYRRLEVSAWARGRREDAERTLLMRRFAPIDGELREVSDDRVPAREARRVVLSLPRARDVEWRIDWHALDPTIADARWLPREDVVRTIAEGAIDR